MITTRYASVWSVPDHVEFQIAEQSEWSCNCCIDAGTVRMLGPIHPLEQPQSSQHDRIVCRQGQDKTFRVQLERAHRS